MRSRTLGWTGLRLSTVGLGTWALGGGGWVGSWGPQDDDESVATIARAVERGVNWIDTAPIYGFHHAEEVVGRAIKGMREKPLIATKLSRVWDEGGKVSGNLKKERIRPALEGSLRRLHLEAIDLYQIHWPDPDPDIEEAWGAIADLIKAGKIRYAGVCNFRLDQIRRIQPIHPIASVQLPYSLLRPRVEGEVLPYCARHNIGFLSYSPMEEGLLTGKFTRERVQTLAADDHRRREARFQDPLFGTILELVEELRPVAASRGVTLAQLAITWVLRHLEVTAALAGARRPSQIEETVSAADCVIGQAEIETIARIFQKYQPRLNLN